MGNSVYLVVSVWIQEGAIADFEAYERKAARVMRRYGGFIERVIRPDSGGSPDIPFEIHVVRFPDREKFAAYRADSEIRSLLSERDAAILKTVVIPGMSGPAYAA